MMELFRESSNSTARISVDHTKGLEGRNICYIIGKRCVMFLYNTQNCSFGKVQVFLTICDHTE